MSEAFDKVIGISTLPLFPLPLVLLPNEILPLHIFEPRYRRMLKDIELGRNMFGLTYFHAEGAAVDRPQPGSIGCAAEVRDVQTTPDGRSNIVTQGVIRYRLTGYADAGTPYLTGEVEFFEDEPDATPQLELIADEVHEVFERIAKAAFKLSENKGQLPEIPRTDPERLSFLVTAAFNLDNELKLELLSTTITAERLERLRTILLQAVDQMEESAEIHRVARTNGHSKKNIDLG
jgi:Lon protease-like protein